MKIHVGDIAPELILPDKNGTLIKLNDIKTKYVVVYFYPRDNTPGCTLEAQNFNVKLPEFEKLDTTIIGISGGDEKSKTKFCKKHDLKLHLLSDADGSVGKSYDSYGLKKFMGREYQGFMRNTFLLNKKHKVIHIFENVKPATHIKEILDLVKSLS